MISRKTTLLATACLAAAGACGPARAQARLQVSSGLQYSSGDYGEMRSTSALVVPFSTRLSFGAWSLRASLPYVAVDGPADVREFADDDGDDSAGSSGGGSTEVDDDDLERGEDFSNTRSTSGLGDATLAATYSLEAIADSHAYLDLTGRVRLPTGSEREGLGVGTTDYFALAEIGWNGAVGGLFFEAGRRFLGSTAQRDRIDGWQVSTGGWLNAGSRIVVGVSYDWRNASVRGGEDPSSAEAYVSWRLSDAWKIEVNGGIGLSDVSADYNVGLTLIWRTVLGR